MSATVTPKNGVPWCPAELLAADARRCPGLLPSIQPRMGGELAALARVEDLLRPRRPTVRSLRALCSWSIALSPRASFLWWVSSPQIPKPKRVIPRAPFLQAWYGGGGPRCSLRDSSEQVSVPLICLAQTKLRVHGLGSNTRSMAIARMYCARSNALGSGQLRWLSRPRRGASVS